MIGLQVFQIAGSMSSSIKAITGKHIPYFWGVKGYNYNRMEQIPIGEQ